LRSGNVRKVNRLHSDQIEGSHRCDLGVHRAPPAAAAAAEDKDLRGLEVSVDDAAIGERLHAI